MVIRGGIEESKEDDESKIKRFVRDNTPGNSPKADIGKFKVPLAEQKKEIVV